MKTIDVQARLEYARAAVAVLRALRIADKTMRSRDLATAIGLMSDSDHWEPWHRQQISDILNLVAATKRKASSNADTEPLQFERVVTGDGQPGTGFYKTARITVD
jgi:hypothetical protein